MDISDITVRKTTGTTRIKGSGSFKYGMLSVNFTIQEGKNGLFVSLPSHSYEKDGQRKWVNDVFVDKNNFRDFSETLLRAFESEQSGTNSLPENSSQPTPDDGVPF